VTDTTTGTALAVRRPAGALRNTQLDQLSPDARTFVEILGRLADQRVTGARTYTAMLHGAMLGGPDAVERVIRRVATEIVTLAHTLRDLQAIAGHRQLAGSLTLPDDADAERFLAELLAEPARQDAEPSAEPPPPAEAPTVPLPPARRGGVDPAEVEAAAARAAATVRVGRLDEGGGEAVARSLVTAQRMADQTVTQARATARAVVREAEARAAEITQTATDRARELTEGAGR
jgi:hypothetical protein